MIIKIISAVKWRVKKVDAFTLSLLLGKDVKPIDRRKRTFRVFEGEEEDIQKLLESPIGITAEEVIDDN